MQIITKSVLHSYFCAKSLKSGVCFSPTAHLALDHLRFKCWIATGGGYLCTDTDHDCHISEA